jgi:hypothetical protein
MSFRTRLVRSKTVMVGLDPGSSPAMTTKSAEASGISLAGGY